ncbi:MAG: hypothetical protein K2G65_02780 [Eubacterium sp.]|nr:hypothetical protein [Eubacterium sp.]
MRRNISLAFILMLICSVFIISPINAAANDNTTPVLVDISFKNAKIDSAFSHNVQEYTITLNDNTATPTLDSYAIKGDADLFVNYLYDETNHQIGLTATLQYETGSKIYNFTYSNPAAYVQNSNSNLSSIYSPYSELSPSLNDSDTVYKLYIPSDLTELTITPVTSDINAYCAPVTLTLSADQTPKITLTCTASDGSRKNYSINIKRVNKTTEQVKAEMQQPDYVSFVDGTRVFEKPEFIMIVCAVLGGLILIMIMFAVTKRIAVNPYDKEEKPFYCSVE